MKVSELQHTSKTACLYPFTYVNFYPEGRYSPCCASNLSDEENVFTSSDIWNSPILKKIRSKLSLGEKPSECEGCFLFESYNMKSLRHESWEHISLNVDSETRCWDAEAQNINMGPNTVKIALGNLCNLQCRMCVPEFSSRWSDFWFNNKDVREWHKNNNLRIHSLEERNLDKETQFTKIYDFLKKHKSSLKRIEFIGGEPLIQNEHYHVLDLFKDQAEHMVLDYSSNLMKLGVGKHSIFEHWPNYYYIALTVSIDGPPALNEYIRAGGKTKIIESNLDQVYERIKKLHPTSFTTFSLYNIFAFADTIRYCTSLGLLFISNPLQDPSYLSVQCLPQRAKNQLTHEMQEFIANAENELAASFEKKSTLWSTPGRKEEQLQRIKRRLDDLINFMNGDDKSYLFPRFFEFDNLISKNLKTSNQLENLLPLLYQNKDLS